MYPIGPTRESGLTDQADSMKQNITIESAGVSDIGKQRACNEDTLTVSDELGLYAIADGMGGHMHGDVASQSVIETLLHDVTNYFDSIQGAEKQQTCYEVITASIVNCNNLILQKNRNNSCRIGEGMGTTLVGAYFLNDTMQAVTFNVGDSRIYRLRDKELTQITRDQTMYQEWLDGGAKGIAPSQNILVNAVGLVEELSADIRLESLAAGDVYLVCSDGLSSLVDDESLKSFLCEHRLSPVGDMCNRLINMANEQGGSDNITVIVIRVAVRAPAKPIVGADPQTTLQRIKRV